jgi:hypothetical protein
VGFDLKISFAKTQQPTQQQAAIARIHNMYGIPQNGLFRRFVAATPDGSIFLIR